MSNRNSKKDPFFSYSSDEESDDHVDDCRNFCKPQNHDYFWSFLRESSIHGLKYIGQLDQSMGARIFWMANFACLVGISVYLIMIGVAADLLANPVIMSFQESEITIDRIPFPAVTICSSSKRRTDLFQEQLMEYSKIQEQIMANKRMNVSMSEDAEKDYYRRYYSLIYLLDLCQDSNGFSDHFQTPLQRNHISALEVNNSDLEFVMKYARKVLHKCENIVLLCMWASEPFDCANEFHPIITEYGNCCTFNMIPEFILRKNFPHRIRNNRSRGNSSRQRQRDRETKAWSNWAIDKHLIEGEEENKSRINVPKHQRNAGLSSGLSILIDPDFDDTVVDEYDLYYGKCDSLDGFGFRVQVHSPIDYPHISDFGKTIQTNTETFIDITAAITMPDPDVKDISMDKRRCYFSGEQNLSAFKDYTQKNCVDECIINEVERKCKCVRMYMPRQSQPLCMNPSEYDCIKNATTHIMEDGAEELCGHCWPSCTQLEYFAATTEFPLRDDINIWKNTFNKKDVNASRFQKDAAIVHLYFSKDNVESRARKSLYGSIEILASAGGVIGLTLGISMISFVEPIYFLTIRRLFEKKRSRQSALDANKRRMANSTPTQIFVQPIQSKVNKNDGSQFVVKRIPRAWIQN